MNYDALLVFSFGGPEKPDDVIPFLENVLRGRNVPRERMLEVAEHYYHFGGKSPINDQNRALIAELQKAVKLPVYWGNRNWHPMLADTLRQMQADGVKRAVAFVTSAFGSFSGCRQYAEDIAKARAEVGEGAPEITRIRPFSKHPKFVEAMTDRDSGFPITRVIPHAGALYLHGVGHITTYSRGRFGAQDVYDFPADQGWDFGALPSPRTRDAVSWGSRLLIATDRGVGVLRGASLTAWQGPDGLPYEDVSCLAVGGEDDVWIGTTHGAVHHQDDRWDYFHGERWLPGNHIHAIAVAGRQVALATDQGLARLRWEPYTLAKQASYFEKFMEAWGQKRLGMTAKLEWDDGRREFVREVGDNDGGYSGDYLAAQCYRYAVTGDPDVTFNVDAALDNHAISPYIYGDNFFSAWNADLNLTLGREGGKALAFDLGHRPNPPRSCARACSRCRRRVASRDRAAP